MLKSIGLQAYIGIGPVYFLGTYAHNNQANFMAVNYITPCANQPPSLAVAIEKTNYTYNLIQKNKSFTINLANSSLAKELDLAGTISGKNENKTERLGLKIANAEHINAPYITNSPLVSECALVNSIEFASHTLFIAEILDLKVEQSLITRENKIDGSKLDNLLYCSQSLQYLKLGDFFARAFAIGKTL